MGKQKNWTKEEKIYLAENYHSLPIDILMDKMNRSNQSIRKKANHLNLTKSFPTPRKTNESITTTKRYQSSQYKKCLDFAKSLGFNNVSEAVDNFGGSRQFTNEFKKVG